MGRRLTTSIDRLFPDVSRKVVQTQLQQKNYHDQHITYRPFQVQDRLFIRNYANGPIWVPGVILAISGPPLSYQCQLVDGRRVRRHQDQLRKREVEVTPPVVREGLRCGEGLPEMVDSFQKAPDPVVAGGPFDLTLEDSLLTPEEPVIRAPMSSPPTASERELSPEPMSTPESEALRQSTRIRKESNRLDL
ncbi:uncharacterized protein LOC134182628 [Corticium candelabrum]|uniref:uncharacterized protein LOC134182628 n=1 Tax=Corticium candelabrum TaxID=121492 RepID=UPI002E252BEE|nr:uncharacterized protein LOC134182628 [Corticium candelabrum]